VGKWRDLPQALKVAPVDWSPSLAGLRGLAIILVVLFHLGLPVAGGGLVGVTVFFVLSGFLITSLLETEIRQAGRVDLWAFYARRLRRLAPALTFAVVVVLGVAATAGRSSDVLADSLLAVTFTSNWARAGGDGVGMWNHAWSLAIEGQFCVLWPVVVVGIARYIGLTSGRALALLLVLAATSALTRIALAAVDAPDVRSYFGTDTRAEALVLGGALACLLARRPDIAVPDWAGVSGVAVVVVLALLPDPDLGWPGSHYSAVAISTAVVILAVRTNERGFGLASRPMAWFGERSYSLYLWHVPVILVLGPFEDPGRIGGVVAAVVTMLALTELSYRYVEGPFRRRGAGTRRDMSVAAPRPEPRAGCVPVPEAA
jgi:peptidoglycan/LPS O-acetylase OafA/YrhL